MKTNELRKLIQGILKNLCDNVYYETADDANMYPHIVFSLESANLDDVSRDDVTVNVDIWDKGSSAVRIEELADKTEAVFDDKNMPTENILPTCYLIDRKIIPDEDKKIKHRLVRVLVQNYERK